MEFLRAIICFVVVIGIAILLGRLDHHKHPVAYVYSVIGSIVVLLSMRIFL